MILAKTVCIVHVYCMSSISDNILTYLLCLIARFESIASSFYYSDSARCFSWKLRIRFVSKHSFARVLVGFLNLHSFAGYFFLCFLEADGEVLLCISICAGQRDNDTVDVAD